MRIYPVIILLFCITACSSLPTISELPPADPAYVKVVTSTTQDSNELTRAAIVFDARFPSGRTALPKIKAGEARTLVDFYILPGLYVIDHSCERISSEVYVSKTVRFLPGRNYVLRCEKKAFQLVVESTPVSQAK